MASISKVETELGLRPAPFMATFSSRGTNILEQSILKPDITTPAANKVTAKITVTVINSYCRHRPFQFQFDSQIFGDKDPFTHDEITNVQEHWASLILERL